MYRWLVPLGFVDEHDDSFNLSLCASAVAESFLGWVDEIVSFGDRSESVVDDRGIDLVGRWE